MFQLDGALKLFVDYILASAVRPQPILAIGASLCALGALMGRKYRTQTNLRTNLYVVGMAGSGGGKDHARKRDQGSASSPPACSRYLGGNRIASGAGLLTALYRQPSSLFQLDEFGQFLGNVVNKRHAPKYLAEIWDLLTELSTSAGGTFFGAEYADQKRAAAPGHRPALLLRPRRHACRSRSGRRCRRARWWMAASPASWCSRPTTTCPIATGARSRVAMCRPS